MENKQATLELGTKPVGKLLVQYALPAMIAMTAASLYNIVDRVFIGQGVGAMAISGLAITFPFMNRFRSRCGRRSIYGHQREAGTKGLCHGAEHSG